MFSGADATHSCLKPTLINVRQTRKWRAGKLQFPGLPDDAPCHLPEDALTVKILITIARAVWSGLFWSWNASRVGYAGG